MLQFVSVCCRMLQCGSARIQKCILRVCMSATTGLSVRCVALRMQYTLQHTLQHTQCVLQFSARGQPRPCNTHTHTHASKNSMRARALVRVCLSATMGLSLRCVAERCNMLQCVAVLCNTLQYVAVRCNMLQCVAVRYNMLQCVASRRAS